MTFYVLLITLFLVYFYLFHSGPSFFVVNEEIRRKLQFCSVTGCWPASQSTQPMYKYLRQREVSDAKKFSQKPTTVKQMNGKRHLGFKPQTHEGGSTSFDKSLTKQVAFYQPFSSRLLQFIELCRLMDKSH